MLRSQGCSVEKLQLGEGNLQSGQIQLRFESIMVESLLNSEQLEFAPGPHGGDKMIGLGSLGAGR